MGDAIRIDFASKCFRERLELNGILQFDSKKLSDLLDKFGIERTWKSILVTRIHRLESHNYILSDPEFGGIPALEEDLLEGLSIGEISVLYEFSVAHLDPHSRKQNGQYFTPDDVAKFMVGQISMENFRQGGVWLDPCSGIGNLSWHLISAANDPEDFLRSNLICSDRDPLALLIARTLLTLDFQKSSSPLFFEIKENFQCFDFLSSNGEYEFGAEQGNMLTKIPKHDYVIVNPPYLATKRDPRFETSEASDLYAYFLENVIKTSEGFISITPQSFTNAAKFRTLRKLLTTYSYLIIFCFDNVPANIFRGIKFGSRNSNTSNSTRAAITVASKIGSSHEITPLLRWKAKQRGELFETASKFLSKVSLGPDFFPKVHPELVSLFKEVTKHNHQKLADLTSSRGDFVLYVPSSPRYFIPALKTKVSRSSMHEVRFPTLDSMNKAYVLINSSFTYWWWRVRDGGMTLSIETLLTTPVPNSLVINPEVIASLEGSEISNKVFKKNAGAHQENVKHDLKLIERVNLCVVDSAIASMLIKLHGNSELDAIK